MMTPQDYRALLAKRTPPPEPKHIHLLRDAPRLAEVTHKAQTVIDHPGWQYFMDAVESRVQTLSAERDTIARRMVSGDELGQELERMKIKLNRIEAEMSGLRFAATLIPQAVAFGQQVVAGANGSVAGTRADT